MHWLAAAIAAVTAVGNGQVAYVRTAGTDTRGSWITVADLDGRNAHAITRRDKRWSDRAPAWSPDGSLVAFVRVPVRGSVGGLYVAGADGSGLRRVLSVPASVQTDRTAASVYAWSPDGRKLAFAYGGLSVVNSDGTDLRTLVARSACAPAWSPDSGSLLYFVDTECGGRGGLAGDPGYRRIRRVDVDGSNGRLLATGSFGGGSWSPDGQTIAFTDNCDVHHWSDWLCSVAVMAAVDGSGRHRIFTGTFGARVSWLPAGTELVYSAYPRCLIVDAAVGTTRAAVPASFKSAELVGLSSSTGSIAVVTDAARPAIVGPDARLVRRVVVPSGWRADGVAVFLP